MEKSYSSVSRIFELSISSENQSIVTSSRRHHHWASFRSSHWKLLRCYIHRRSVFLWMKLMITNKSSGPAVNCSQFFLELGRNEEGKVTRSHKETWAAPSTKETSADLVILTPRASLFTKKNHSYEWEKVDKYAHSHDMGEIWQCQFPNWPLRCFDIMTKMNDNLMVRDIGTPWNHFGWKRLHTKELETLMMDIGYSYFMSWC